jgi:uncharacterized protein (TIGR00369 family)
MNDPLKAWNQSYVDVTPHMVDIGARVTAVGKGQGSMMMPARPDWLGDPVRGLLHPGALTVLADSACGLAVVTSFEKRVPIATLDLRMDYLRPAGPDHDVFCEAQCYRLTRNIGFVRGELWQEKRDEPIATVQAAFILTGQTGPRSNLAGGSAAREDASAALAAWQAPTANEKVLPLSPIPYVEYLGIRFAPDSERPLFRMPFQAKLIGNPILPAVHGGVVAGFAETAATLHLIQTLKGAKFPKSIDFSMDYLRSCRPEETFAQCEVVRVGARVALVQVRCWQKSPDYPITVARAQFLLTPAS